MTGSYESFKRGVLVLSGIDLNSYKESQMKRRIDSFIQKEGLTDYNEFLIGMRHNTNMLHSFVSYLTINVSEFCRNPEQWTVFENKIIPILKRNKNGKIRMWSAACSTGEEPYTIAMFMSKYFTAASYEILATDIDVDALSFANKGIYPERAVNNISNEFRNKYFRFNENTYEIRNIIKNQIDFKKHNLLNQFYPKDIDFISCRNVTIYFTAEAKNEIYKKLSDSIRKDGVLFIGSTEQIQHPEGYGLKSIDTFFYQKR